MGIKYDGNNIKDVIYAFSPLDNVMWSADDGSLTSSSGQCVCIGDWVVNDEGVVRIYSGKEFSLRFEEKKPETATTRVRSVRVAEPLLVKEDFHDDDDREDNYYEEWR